MPCSIPPGTGTPSSPAGVPVRPLETGQAVPGRVCAAKQEKYYGFKVLMNSAGEIFRWWPANTDEREMLDASAIPVRRQGADLRRLGRPVGRARCRLDDAASGKHEGRPSAVADPAGDAPAAGDQDGLRPPRRGLRRLAEQGPGLLEVVGPVPPQSSCLQPLTPVRAHLRQGMTSFSYAGNPRFGYHKSESGSCRWPKPAGAAFCIVRTLGVRLLKPQPADKLDMQWASRVASLDSMTRFRVPRPLRRRMTPPRPLSPQAWVPQRRPLRPWRHRRRRW